MDSIIGKRFGRLVVTGFSESVRSYVVCKCDCGNVVTIRKTSLTQTKHPTRSCGCIQVETARHIGLNNIKKNSKNRIERNIEFNTNFSVIETKNPPINNKSGHKGVWFDKDRNKWMSYISVNSKRLFLGRYDNYEDAVDAREKGERVWHDPLIEQKNNEEIMEENHG